MRCDGQSITPLTLDLLQHRVKQATEQVIPTPETTLRRHVVLGDVKAVEFLLKQVGVNVNDVSPSGKTALDFAVAKRKSEMVDYLKHACNAKLASELTGDIDIAIGTHVARRILL